MSDASGWSPTTRTMARVLGAVVIAGIAGWGLYSYLQPRGAGLADALQPLIDGKDADLKLVAQALASNYAETRSNAKSWSGIYWGFTFAAAALSALAGLVLKIDALIRNEGTKKDVAAICAVAAALLITVSTSGDFQRKWQANRIAAAELERAGYEFLGTGTPTPRPYLTTIGEIQHRRHLAIVGLGVGLGVGVGVGDDKPAAAEK